MSAKPHHRDLIVTCCPRRRTVAHVTFVPHPTAIVSATCQAWFAAAVALPRQRRKFATQGKKQGHDAKHQDGQRGTC